MTTIQKFILPISLFFVALIAWISPASAAGPGYAIGVGWDARTRVINNYLTDGDIQQVLSQGLTPAFARAFPSNTFGLFVLVDKSQSKELSQQVVYVLLSLCKRRPDGSYELPLATYSIVIPMNAGSVTNGDPERQERMFIAQRMLNEVKAFDQVMVKNADKFR
ncbi:MAG: hypothetical protein ACRDDF_00330 [Aeromonas sp.]